MYNGPNRAVARFDNITQRRDTMSNNEYTQIGWIGLGQMLSLIHI